MVIEKIDLYNIIEIQQIRKLLIHHPDLLSMLEIMIIICNNKINEDETI